MVHGRWYPRRGAEPTARTLTLALARCSPFAFVVGRRKDRWPSWWNERERHTDTLRDLEDNSLIERSGTKTREATSPSARAGSDFLLLSSAARIASFEEGIGSRKVPIPLIRYVLSDFRFAGIPLRHFDESRLLACKRERNQGGACELTDVWDRNEQALLVTLNGIERRHALS
jgi:hypothetical protein